MSHCFDMKNNFTTAKPRAFGLPWRGRNSATAEPRCSIPNSGEKTWKVRASETMKIDHLKWYSILKAVLWIISIQHLLNKNPLFIQSTIKQTDIIPVIKHFLSWYLTQTLHTSHERESPRKSWDFFWVWSNIGTSSGKPPCRTWPPYVGLFNEMPTGFARSGADTSSFSFPPLPQQLVVNHLWQLLPALYVHRVKKTSSEVPFCVLYPPMCVRVWISCWLARPGARGRGRMSSACCIACCQVEVPITVHTKIPVELLKGQVILLSTFPLTVGLSPSCGC